MNKKQITALVIGIAVLVGIFIFYITRDGKADGGTGYTPVKTTGDDQKFGALAGPDIASPYLKWGDFETVRAGTTFNTASSTLCSIQAPSATSTVRFYAQIQTATSSQFTAVLDNDTDGFARTLAAATSSLKIAETVIVGDTTAAFGYQSSTTATNLNTDYTGVIGPNRYLVFFADDGDNQFDQSLTGHGLTGICKAEFDVIGR